MKPDEWALVLGAVSLLATIILAILAFLIAEKAARNDVVFQIRDWGDQVVALTGDAIAELKSPSICSASLRVLVERASALADAGRFHYPNTNNRAYGTALTGVRHEAVDLVVVLHGLLRTASLRPEVTSEAHIDAVVCVRRAFVDLTFRCTNFRTAKLTLGRHLDFVQHMRSADLWAGIPSLLPKNTSTGSLTFKSTTWKVV